MESKKKYWITFGAISIVTSFIILLCLYNFSDDKGYLGISQDSWNTIWGISQSGLSLSLCGIVILMSYGLILLRIMRPFIYCLIPYFIAVLVYVVSCYSGSYLLAPEQWENLWSWICVIVMLIGLIFCFYIIKKKNHAT